MNNNIIVAGGAAGGYLFAKNRLTKAFDVR
jgi:hypothetical protein